MVNREIDYVLEVAKTGSILKASEKLFISSSALSKYIQNLESRLDVKLFDRNGKHFELTYAGERYIYWINRQHNLIREMNIELTDIANSVQGVIRVGIPIGLSNFWISNVLIKFHQEYPEVKIKLIEDTSININKMISDNNLDFAITEIFSDSSDLISVPLYEETIVLMCSICNDDLTKLSSNRSDHKYPWIPLDKCTHLDFITAWPEQNMAILSQKIFDEYNIRPNNLVTAKSIHSILECVQVGLGVCLTTDFSIILSGSHMPMKAFSIGTSPFTRSWSMVYNKNHHITKNVKSLMDLTSSEYTSIDHNLDQFFCTT